MYQSGPYQIEYAQLLTGKALEARINAIRAPKWEKKNKAIPILEKNRDILLAEYHKVEQKAIQEFKDRHNELLLQKNAFDKKECEYCQRPLRLVRNDYQDHYVCSEFRDGNQHSKFYVDFEERIQARLPWIKIRIEMDWLTNILKATALKGQVYLLEIKRNPYNIIEDQLPFYQALLQHIMEKAPDQRRIHPVFLVYNTPEYSVPYLAGTYVLFEEIKPLQTVTAIISKFEIISDRKSYEYRLINPSDYHL